MKFPLTPPRPARRLLAVASTWISRCEVVPGFAEASRVAWWD